MKNRIIPILVSAFILLGITGAGIWFYRDDLSAWRTKRQEQIAPSAAPSAAVDHSQHAPVGQQAAAAESSAGPQSVDHSQMDHSKMGQSGQPMAGPEQPPAKPGERKILYWYDPMHPAYKSNKPGTAPDCGMDLVPMYAEESPAGKDLPPGTVKITAQKQQLIGVRTAKVERKTVQRILRAVGKFTIDETKIAQVHTRFPGYIEEVFVDFVGKPVKAGEPLFTIYSPELLSTQQEYLIARRSQNYFKDSPYREVSSGSESLAQAARERLRLAGMREEDIERLAKEGKPMRTLTVNSPASGIISERDIYSKNRYVTPEMVLFVITDYSKVWMVAEVFEYEAPYVKLGQEATVRLSYYPGKEFRGKVSYIFPSVDPQTRTVKVRFDFPNPDQELKPEMFADVELQVNYGTQVVVPQEAVLDSGRQQTVFVAHEDGYFEPRSIKTGPRLVGLPRDAKRGEEIVVLSGLKPGETIVTSANFLVDSESRLKSATSSLQHQH